MNIGMLWFDNDPKTAVNDKIGRAVSYYQKKYGKSPNLCFVHPSMLTNGAAGEAQKAATAGGVELRSSGVVLPNHFWIGVNGKPEEAGS